MHMLKRVARLFDPVISFARKHPYISAAGGVVALYIVYSVFFSGSKVEAETMVVAAQDFTAAVSVAGTVVSAQDVDLGFAAGGRIGAVYVKAGDRVAAGTVLASLENGDVRAALQRARAQYASVAEGTRAEELSIAQSDVDSAREALVVTLKDAYRAADDAVRNATGELFEEPRTRASFKFAASNSRYNKPASDARKELERILPLWQSAQASLTVSSDLTAATALAEQNLAKVADFLRNTNLALADAEPEEGYATQAELTTYISDVAAARSAVSDAQAAVSSDKFALTTAQKNLALKKAGATASDIAIEAAEIRAAEAEVAKTLITAPFSGLVGQVDAKVGAIASANTPLISMLASDSFLIESYIPEIAIADVAVGDTAQVYLDAYGQNVPFDARVSLIDPAETERDGISTYKTTLQFISPDERIRSGLTANMTISTEHKANALVIPQGALIRRGEDTFVKLLIDEELVERQVTTGLSSVGHIEIVSGLSAGDILVLNP